MADEEPDTFEEHLISLMKANGTSLRQTLFTEFRNSEVDITNVYDLVDHLEAKLENLEKVKYYMEVFTGYAPDIIIRSL